jgi:large subunit ribosomal protein L21
VCLQDDFDSLNGDDNGNRSIFQCLIPGGNPPPGQIFCLYDDLHCNRSLRLYKSYSPTIFKFMATYAVMKTGGKQYRVAPGDVVKVEKLAVAPGATVEISEVYLLANSQGITVGNPIIANARVVAEVIEEGRHEKVIIFKKKRRKGYQRTIGHRQYFTTLRISEIALGDNVYKAEATVPRPDASKVIAAAPAQPLPTKSDRTKASATKFVPTPKAPSPKETASAKTPEPMIVARETTSPIAPSGDTPPESRIETAKIATAPPVSGTGNARIIDTVPAAEPSIRAEEKQPTKAWMPPTPQPEAAEEPTRHKYRYWIVAVIIIALLTGIGFLIFGDRDQRRPENAVPVSAQPEKTTPPKAKPPVRDVNIKKPTGASTPSAPVRPPD